MESLGFSSTNIQQTTISQQQLFQESSAAHLPQKLPVYQSKIANMVSFTYTSFALLAAATALQGVAASGVGAAVKGVISDVGKVLKVRGETEIWERGKQYQSSRKSRSSLTSLR